MNRKASDVESSVIKNMLKDRNILCISTPPWEGDYASTIVELMKILARTNRILYVDNPHTIKDFLTGMTGKKKIPWKNILGIKNRLKKLTIEQGVEVYLLIPPMILSINFLPEGSLYNFFLRMNGWLIRKAIWSALKRLDMHDNLINIVSFNPAMGIVNGRRFNEKLLVYHCYDEIEAAKWMNKHGGGLEKEFMKMADAVIVTSQGLYEKKCKSTNSCFLVKNAANVELFSTAFTEEKTVKKTVGFIGSIDERLDFELLEYTIENLPEFDFIFIGRITDHKGALRLRKFKNVAFTGAKKMIELPDYVKRFSIGIIPFRKNEFTKGIYPLKINEYLAAGLPVVTTDFSYLGDFENVVSIAGSKEQFRESIQREINRDTLEYRINRQTLAKQNSWEHRAEELSTIIQNLEK